MIPQAQPSDGGARRPFGALEWAALWSVVTLETVGMSLYMFLQTDLSTMAFNNWRDPCLPPNEGSQLCTDVLARVVRVTNYFFIPSIVLGVGGTILSGALSDIAGRKVTAMLAIFLSLLNKLTLIIVGIFHGSVYWVMASSELQCILPIAVPFYLVITDVTEPHERAVFFGRFEALVALEGILSPLIAMVASYQQVIVGVNASTLLCLFVVAFGLRETFVGFGRPILSSTESMLKKAPDQEGPLTARLKSLGKILENSSYRRIVLLACLLDFNTAGSMTVMFPYLKHKFGLNMSTIAPISMVSSAGMVAANLFAVRPLQRRLGFKGVVVLGILVGNLFNILLAVAPTAEWLLHFGFITGLTTISTPMVTSMTTIICEQAQSGGDMGSAMGAFQALKQVAGALGAVIFRFLFLPAFSMDGGIWFFAILLNCISLLVVLGMRDIVIDDETAPLIPQHSHSSAEGSDSAP